MSFGCKSETPTKQRRAGPLLRGGREFVGRILFSARSRQISPPTLAANIHRPQEARAGRLSVARLIWGRSRGDQLARARGEDQTNKPPACLVGLACVCRLAALLWPPPLAPADSAYAASKPRGQLEGLESIKLSWPSFYYYDNKPSSSLRSAPILDIR